MRPFPAWVKHFIKNSARLYARCLSPYPATRKPRPIMARTWGLLTTPSSQLKRMLIRYPNLYPYACHCREIGTGRLAAGFGKIRDRIAVDWWSWHRLRRHKPALGKLYQLHQQAILCCVRHRTPQWWDFLPDTRFDSVPALRHFLRECVLRRAGDYREFLRLSAQLTDICGHVVQADTFYHDIARHYASAIEAIDAGRLTRGLALDQSRGPLVIGFSVWGERYLHLFLHYCLPSLMAQGNLPALCKQRQPVLLIHTNPQGKARLEAADITHAATTLGVLIVYRMIDETLVNRFDDHPDFKYWHLGMVQSLDLYFAKVLDADYHLLMPDTVYSAGHFSGLLNAVSRGHPVITKIAYRTRLQGVCPALEDYRKDGVISIAAADLAALGIRHLHTDAAPLFLTNKAIATQLPNVHVVIWEGRDTLHLLSPHQTILYLDRAVLRRMAKRYFLTLDSELDKIVPEDFPVYCPKADDAMHLIEISPGDPRPAKPSQLTVKEFSRMFWANAGSLAYWRFFAEDVIDPLNRRLLPGRDYMDDRAIQRAKQQLRKELLNNRPAVTAASAKAGLAMLQAVQSHPAAGDCRQLLADTARQLQEHIGGNAAACIPSEKEKNNA